jgi:hypothetical protein
MTPRLAPILPGLACLAACADPPPAHAPPLREIPATVDPVEPSEWLREHFAVPLAPQGAPPAAFSALEARIDPEACGACHPAQLRDWSESWHAIGVGPGVLGQYLDWDGVDDAMVAKCNRCHAPLAEQQLRVLGPEGAWVDNPAAVPGARDQGLTCAGCHVRGHRRYGPPPSREGLVPDAAGEVTTGPHGGFVSRAEFQSPAFCKSCHDFTRKSDEDGLHGKLLQETTEEWRRTPRAAAGQTCQSCHMPEGRHLWKGIHDPELVRSGVQIGARLQGAGGWLQPVEAELWLENVGAAHRFPTYTTPEVRLVVEQVDAKGAPIEGTLAAHTIARRVSPDLKVERFDTRLLPGEVARLAYAERRAGAAVALRARVEVWPDEAYRRFYEIKLKKPDAHEKGAELLREALQRSVESRYTLWEQTLSLGGGEGP